MLNKIQEDIEVNKELITNLPRNNVKNAKKVLEKILELQNDYQIKLQDVIKEKKKAEISAPVVVIQKRKLL